MTARVLCRAAAAAALACLASTAAAEDPKDGKLHGDVDLGYSSENKNVDSRQARFAVQLRRETEQSRQLGTFNYNFESVESDTTVENWNLETQFDYRYTERRYSFARNFFEKDDFSSFDYQNTLAIGYGYTPLLTETMRLDLEGGPAWRHDELRTGRSEDIAVALGQLRYRWQLSDSAEFEQFVSVEASENTIVRSDTSLKMNVIGGIATRLLVRYKHIQDVEPGLVNDEWETAINLVYSF